MTTWILAFIGVVIVGLLGLLGCCWLQLIEINAGVRRINERLEAPEHMHLLAGAIAAAVRRAIFEKAEDS